MKGKCLLALWIIIVSTNVIAKPRRCKFSIPCDSFTENKSGFCEKHQCHSYGCNRVVMTRSAIGQRFVCDYCAKHLCSRVIPACSDKGFMDAMMLEASIDGNLINVIYCNDERLIGSQYCKKHTCVFKNCKAMVVERWIHESGRRAFKTMAEEFVGGFAFSLKDFDNWVLRSLDVCMGHSNTEKTGDKIKDDSMTYSEAQKRKELGKEMKDMKKMGQ